MIEFGFLDILKIFFQWLFDKKVRLQLSGYRPEVVCLVRCNTKPRNYLLIKPSAEPCIWIPPHEGVMLDETLEGAAIRCLRIELGLEEDNIQFRKSKWLGKRILPTERWDERDLQYSLLKIFSKHNMIGKGYFGALVIADKNVVVRPNGAEVCEWRWANETEYNIYIQSNPPEKIHIFRKLLEMDN